MEQGYLCQIIMASMDSDSGIVRRRIGPSEESQTSSNFELNFISFSGHWVVSQSHQMMPQPSQVDGGGGKGDHK